MFKQLLATLQNLDVEQGEVLAKSVQPAQDDNKIQAAAAASGANNGEGSGAGPGEGEGEGKGEGEGDDADKKKKEGEGEGEGEGTLTKSLTGANGEELIDATEVLESLQKSMNDSNEMLGTAIPTMIGMMKRMGETIVAQGEMIKSLQTGQIASGAQGAGRKSQVVLLAKSAAGAQAAASEEPQLTADDLMIKSNAAYSAGKISGVELGMIDLALRSRQLPDADLLARVTGAKL